jgi:hypothetical protein
MRIISTPIEDSVGKRKDDLGEAVTWLQVIMKGLEALEREQVNAREALE